MIMKSNHPKLALRQDTECFMGYKRDSKHRIFVNKSLQLGNIKFFGFDMDYTLAMYKSPELELMTFDLLKARMIEIGYPLEVKDFQYDPSFPIRGLWIDKKFGNLLKMDNYNNVLLAFHGFKRMSTADILSQYPNKFVKFEQPRIMVTNTLYNLPETYLIAAIINYFESIDHCEINDTGFSLSNNVTITYSSIIEDIRDAMDCVHGGKEVSQMILNDLEKFVERTPKLAEMLTHLKSNGAKVFLLTNSDYDYTEKICQFLLNCSNEQGNDWTKYFDYIVTDARKPRFFFDGTLLRVVNKQTKKVEIGHHTGPLESGVIYSGGSVAIFSKLIGARGKDVLYFGDHIFGDILKSKKIVGWRTCLIVPEIENEIFVWKHKGDLFDQLQDLNCQLAETYRNLDLESSESPDTDGLRNKIHEMARLMEESYGQLGSLFRSGSRQTFFSDQVFRYADLYTTTCLNLIYYPMSYMFRAPFILMPHESTVSHVDSNEDVSESTLPPIGLRRRSAEMNTVHNHFHFSKLQEKSWQSEERPRFQSRSN